MPRERETYRLWKHRNETIYVLWTERTQVAGGEFKYQTKRISTGTTDWRAAEEYRAQFIAGLNNPAPPSEPTVGYLLKRYRDEHGPNVRWPDTIDHAMKSLNPFFGQLLPRHITNLLFRQYAEQHKHNSAGTTIRQLGVLKAALRHAEGNRWIEPLPALRMPVAQPAPREAWLSRAEVTKLIDNAKSPHIRLFIQLAISTAARSGAILELTWDQVDFENQTINFGKGWRKKRRAVVPMTDELKQNLTEAQKLSVTPNVIEFNGKPVRSIKAAFRRLCAASGISTSPHILRHTAASWLVMGGVPISEVARLLGNSEAMAERVYGKHSPDYLRRAVSILNSSRAPAQPASFPHQ